MALLDQSHAKAIVKKLKGVIEKGKSHDHAVIHNDEGKLIAEYGIRRASKAVGHDFIPKKLRISPHQTLELANCTLSKAEYFTLRREQENSASPHLRNGKQ